MDLSKFLAPTLMDAPCYKLLKTDCEIKLDQNESPFDWPEEVKEKTLHNLKSEPWQKYPEPFDESLNQKLASYVGVQPEQIITGAGSNYLITILMNCLCRHLRGKAIIAEPSFPLYALHARYESMSYEIWPQENFEYDISNLPVIPDHSVIIFASPNNPAGNVLKSEDLEQLLNEHPTSIIVADEAYYEFNDDSYIELFKKHQNLIIMRTLSKTLSSAAIRFGYILCHEDIKNQLLKMRLPFILNKFTLASIHALLDSPKAMKTMLTNAKKLVEWREKLHQELVELSKEHPFKTYPSKANFLLLQLSDNLQKTMLHSHLIENSIIVRDVSKGRGLEGCLRISISTPHANEKLLKNIQSFFKK